MFWLLPDLAVLVFMAESLEGFVSAQKTSSFFVSGLDVFLSFSLFLDLFKSDIAAVAVVVFWPIPLVRRSIFF